MLMVFMLAGDMMVVMEVLDASNASGSLCFTSNNEINCSIMKRAEAFAGPPVGGEMDEDRMMNMIHQTDQK